MAFSFLTSDISNSAKECSISPVKSIEFIKNSIESGLDKGLLVNSFILMSVAYRALKDFQNELISLGNAIDNSYTVEDKIRALTRRASAYSDNSMVLESYIDFIQAEDLIEKNNFLNSNIIIGVKVSKFYLLRSSCKKLVTEALFNEIESHIPKSENKYIIAHYFKAKGIHLADINEHLLAKEQFQKSYFYFNQLNQQEELISLQQKLAISKFLCNDESYKDNQIIYNSYILAQNDLLSTLRYLISLCNSKINPFDFFEISIENYKNAIELCLSKRDWQSSAMLFSFLGNRYEKNNDLANALYCYKNQIEYTSIASVNSDEAKMAEMRFESEIRKIQDENSKVRLMFEELSRLQDKNKSIERFMSHDFLGPSRTIADLCKVLMLSDTQNLTPKGKETLRLIIDAGDMLAEMTGSVWEFMHINEKEGSTFKVFNTEQAIRASFKKYEAELRQNNIMFDIKPPFANILGNSDLLTEAINSLISNSIKYCKQPGAVIRIFCEVDRGNAVITYYDNSKGMNWDVLQRVYNLIGNSDRTGMGNGLALLKNVVELHGGSVKLASGNKEGVSFRLIFPVRTKIILFRRMAQEPENIWSIWKEVHALEEQEKEEVRRFQVEKWGRTFE